MWWCNKIAFSRTRQKWSRQQEIPHGQKRATHAFPQHTSGQCLVQHKGRAFGVVVFLCTDWRLDQSSRFHVVWITQCDLLSPRSWITHTPHLNLQKVITDLNFLCTLAFTLYALGTQKHPPLHTRSLLLKSPLPTLVIHFPRPLAESVCSRRQAPAHHPPTPPPPPHPSRCSIDLFVQSLPPSSSTSSSSSFPYFLHPILPLSVSVSSSASLPYVT